ncbi:MAG: hypothetical protein HYR71_04960 [Chloroflexi bacterium]|nr:hypothetical protein [Chloroflexota bacterium]
MVRRVSLVVRQESLYRLKEAGAAGRAMDTVRDIVLDSPNAKDANRISLLTQLILLAEQAGDTRRVAELNSERASLVALNESGVSTPDVPEPLPAVEPMPANEAVQAAQQRRIAAALKVMQASADGGAIPTALVDELGDALFAEDGVRMAAYTAPGAQQTLAQKVAMARSLIDWLTLKYRVARKGFGLSIVADWEDIVGEVRGQLAQVYENYLLLRTAQAVALPQMKDVEIGASYLLRNQILAGRLGLYPNFPKSNLVARLNETTARLAASQPSTALRVLAKANNGRFTYQLVTDDTWRREEPEAVRIGAATSPVPPRPAGDAATPQSAVPALTQTVRPALNTPVPATPTATIVPPTPTATLLPPTSTSVPATNSPVPVAPTATPRSYP